MSLFQAAVAKWMRTALFWAITHRVVAILCRRVGTTSHFQGRILEDGTDNLSRNVGEKSQLLGA